MRLSLKIALLVAASFWAVNARAAEKTVAAKFGAPFRLKMGEVARFAGANVELRIKKFINSPCPKDARCVWSGLAVITELRVDGKVVPGSGNDAPYDVIVKESDYVRYAVILVQEPKAACDGMVELQRGECLRALARRRGSAGLCREIAEERTRGFCLEDLAEASKDDALCAEVASPTQYCRYLKAKKTGDGTLCEGVVTMPWRELCFKELAK